MRKILMVLTFYPGPSTRRHIRALYRNNFDIKFIFAGREYQADRIEELSNKDIYESKIVFRRSDNFFIRVCKLFSFFKEANSIVKMEKPDIIYLYNYDGLVVSYFSRWHKKYIVFYEVVDLPGGMWRNQSILKRVIDCSDRIMTQSVNEVILTSPYFLKWYEKSAKKFFIMPNLPEKRILERYEKNIHSCFTIGCFGFLRDTIVIKTLIKAVGGMEGIKIIIAGDFVDKNKEDVFELGHRYKNVVFKGHYNYEKEIASLYSSVDSVYVVYSHKNENMNFAFPYRLCESIICGLPVLVTKGSKIAEFVKANKIGFAVIDDDPEDVRQAILRLANDDKLVAEIKERCESLKKDYFYESIEQKFISEIRSSI